MGLFNRSGSSTPANDGAAWAREVLSVLAPTLDQAAERDAARRTADAKEASLRDECASMHDDA